MSPVSSDTITLPGIGRDEHEGPGPSTTTGDLTDELIGTDVWSDGMLAEAGIPMVDVPFVTVGGGIGSFIMTDYLRIAGMPTTSIAALGVNPEPWTTYEYLTRVSQIPRGERLRSDSGSCPDNIWGFPSYAVREAGREKGLANKLSPLWNVFSEPIFTDYYTPRAGQVFEAMEQEAARIDWNQVHVRGLVRMVRRRVGGGYFTILTPPAGTSQTKRIAYRSTYVHLAIGYPGLRFLPDLQAYRQQYEDYSRVVNAYEPHEHVYDELRRKPGTVLVRGGGIVASRVLQRLIDDRDNHGAQTQILHLFRTYIDSSHGPSIFMRRKGKDGWAYQGFNWPKGAWGGQVKFKLEKLEGDQRKALYDVMGGTNTPHRKLWIKQLERGRREGWYRTEIGTVSEVVPGGDGTVVTRVDTQRGRLELPANYIIDCTGLEADIREHRVLADLMDHSGAGRNPLGRLDVDRSFEVRGTQAAPGHLYAVGSATLGGYYSGVDSFLGLQYSCLTIADDLARQGFCPKIGVARSISQWFKRMGGRKP